MNRDFKFYEKKHLLTFPDDPIRIVNIENKIAIFQTKYGLCKKCKYELGRKNYTIASAINKTDYIINQLKEIYGNKFNYSIVEYNNYKSKIKLICPKHNIIFERQVNKLMIGKSVCPKCSKENPPTKKKKYTNNVFINKAMKIHNNKYDYSLIDYKGAEKNIKIICHIHGEFQQRAAHHLAGHGCPKCRNQTIKDINSIRPMGWTLSSWSNAAKKSKRFDSFKVYIIKCWSKDEEFYKIGRTYLKITDRFSSKIRMPYNFKVIKIIKGNAKEVFNLESELKSNNKKSKYIPKIKFNGMYECFNKLE
jgi:predicted nucleic-acid-binding Zn-ribbon protein